MTVPSGAQLSDDGQWCWDNPDNRPNDGDIHGCGRHPAGTHVFRALAQPGHSGMDDTSNTVEID
jgi:sugar lactone lactonase YvrE